MKDFAWKLTKDMLPIDNRIHRKNVEKWCLNKLDMGHCTEIPDIAHKMYNCPAVQYASRATRLILEEFMEKKIEEREILTLSFRHRHTKRNQVGLCFAIRAMYDIYNGSGFNKSQMLS